MEEERIEVSGAPVVFTDAKEPPYNPLIRPTISYKKPTLLLIAFLIAMVGCVWFFSGERSPYRVWACVGFVVLFLAVFGRKAAIWCVRLYQSKASDETRLKCVFEPSCSEYMILAIRKFGLLIGSVKGVRRLLRCHPPNGGQDYPK